MQKWTCDTFQEYKIHLQRIFSLLYIFNGGEV